MRARLFVFLVFMFSGLAAGSFISIYPVLDSGGIVESNESTLNLSLVNGGDEPAYDVLATLDLPEGFSSNDLFPGKMDPEIPYEGEFTLSLENVSSGIYALPLFIDYKDANGHPFSAVQLFSLIVKRAAFSEVSSEVSEISLAEGESRKLKVELQNRGDRTQNVVVRLFVPHEFSVDRKQVELSVEGKSTAEVFFALSSFGALPGSNYLIFAEVSYEEGGLHHSSFSNGVVRVVEPGEDSPSWIPLVALALLLIAFVIYQFKK